MATGLVAQEVKTCPVLPLEQESDSCACVRSSTESRLLSPLGGLGSGWAGSHNP